jgi:hypothetical protein
VLWIGTVLKAFRQHQAQIMLNLDQAFTKLTKVMIFLVELVLSLIDY